MDVINHYDNGARGLRIAASVCIVLGWIILCLSVIATFATIGEIILGVLLLGGIVSWCIMYLVTCTIRGNGNENRSCTALH